MYTIDKIHNLIFFIANKQQNAFFSHDDVDMLLDMCQMGVFSKLTGRPEANTGFFPPQKSGVKQDQWFNDALNPFKKPPIKFLYSDTPSGILTLPSDYIRLNSIYTQVSSNKNSDVQYNGVQILGDDLIADRLNSKILTPSLGKPFGSWAGVNGSGNSLIQLYPKQPQAGYYTYLSRPVAPLYSYTMNGREVVFNPTASKNLAWNDELQLKIMLATMQMLGINISDPSIVQLSELKQKEGIVG